MFQLNLILILWYATEYIEHLLSDKIKLLLILALLHLAEHNQSILMSVTVITKVYNRILPYPAYAVKLHKFALSQIEIKP